MSVVGIIVLVLLVCFAVYLLNRIEMAPPVRNVIYIVLLVLVVLWLADALGYMGNGPVFTRRR